MEAQRRRRVLVVDDEVPILQATRALLEEFDFDVETHRDPATIPEKIREVQPSVVLQDVRMPGLDVRALIEQLRKNEALTGLRIVLFSAGVEAEGLAAELGVGVLPKPFKPQALLAVIATPDSPRAALSRRKDEP